MILAGIDSLIVAKLAGTSVAMIESNYGLRHTVVTAKLDMVKMLWTIKTDVFNLTEIMSCLESR